MQRNPSHRQLQVVAAENACRVKAVVPIVCLIMHPAATAQVIDEISFVTPDEAITARRRGYTANVSVANRRSTKPNPLQVMLAIGQPRLVYYEPAAG